MKRHLALVALLALTGNTFAADWPSVGGNAQRDGWWRGETKLTKAAIGKINLLYAFKLKGAPVTSEYFNSPTVISGLITWLGFKNLVIVGESSGTIQAIDYDLPKIFFDAAFDAKQPKQTAAESSNVGGSVPCPTGMTASVAFEGNSLGPGKFGLPGVLREGRVARNKIKKAVFDEDPAPRVFAVTNDGYLHSALEISGIVDQKPARQFLPPNSYVTGLNVNVDGNRIYAASVGGCGNSPNAIYSINPDTGSVVSFQTGGTGASGDGGTTIGTDGVVYAHIARGHGDVAGAYNDTVVALSPDTLKVVDYFTVAGSQLSSEVASQPGVTPAVIGVKEGNKDWIVAGGHDGRIYILDADSLGGSDHQTPAYRSEEIVKSGSPSAGNGIWHSFATYKDDSGGRWLYVTIHGPAAIDFPVKNGDAETGSILAFKLLFENGKPSLVPAWSSRDLISPAAPAVMNGLVAALSTGQPPRVAKDGKPYSASEREKMAHPARLYLLDSATGKELYVGDKATSYATGGLAATDSKIFFTTQDKTLFAYGIALEK